ncbi:hypothetical protein LEMA_P106170.1 [Plenodomus lingam JN3]|uniref:AMP-activated protein kinase glycogen-binding domain-containing protein n=1 Tax=Leptosphaeria maculans (strain JN3 / isolate v23.1.3 / race Av1-4-5-6-7-8) TaxID=985895 RepID=E5A1M2_LEPMJ|nr:hypothetical protein LEMA_P106170.1 [Plenodomus lingam JN3]CBX97486.1 hypothetical protein LEMA_P106170.1 [Plenodomus lingam JN3]
MTGGSTGNAVIVFSQPGVRPPVHVTTSLSGWTVLEMDADKTQEDSDEFVFKKEFTDVAEGTYQYKIRIGDDHWVLDESTESAPDEHGNLNNVIRVQGQPAPSTDFQDEEHLPDGHLEPVSLPSDPGKDAADAEPDPDEAKVDSPVDPPSSKSAKIPLLVVEKTDDEPAHGDDFGERATSGQKLAHQQRAADASPDCLVIAAESSVSSSPGDEEATPLFRHESFKPDERSTASSIDTVDEESIQSSTDQTSSGNVINTPSEPNESQDDGELGNGPLLNHETGSTSQMDELQAAPLFSHEDGNDQEEISELDKPPLFPHEIALDDDDCSSGGEDELDKAPLLSHETGFSDYKRSEIVTNGEYEEDDMDDMEPQHYGPYGDEDDVPLLPHERDSAVVSKTDSEDDEHFSSSHQPTFGYETDASHQLFGGNRIPNFFRTRTNSSTLPHKLPRTDEDDDNLDDPSLEPFPTNRDQIFERVKSIGLHLPEDEPTDDHSHSPQFSVLSQACSSADLAPVKSYTSLASVPEADCSDEEEEDEDVESLASPIMIGGAFTRAFDKAADTARDDLKTPAANESKQLQLPDAFEPEVSSSPQTTMSSEAEGVDKTDGAKDTVSTTDKLQDASAPSSLASNNVSDTDTPSTFQDGEPTSAAVDSATAPLDSTLRERRKAPETNPSHAQDHMHTDAETQDTGSIGRLIKKCAGDRRKAR